MMALRARCAPWLAALACASAAPAGAAEFFEGIDYVLKAESSLQRLSNPFRLTDAQRGIYGPDTVRGAGVQLRNAPFGSTSFGFCEEHPVRSPARRGWRGAQRAGLWQPGIPMVAVGVEKP